MASITAVYCFKNKKERRDLERYRELVRLLDRQSEQGNMLLLQGLYEAKKNFRCCNIDPCGRGFRIEPGEYFLLVDGKDYDTNHWRLHRACRTEEEVRRAWPLVGVPDNDEVYAGPGEDEERTDPECDENRYFRQLPVDLPWGEDALLPPEKRRENYVSVYGIHEETPFEREDTWGIAACSEEQFADTPKLLTLFRQLVRCGSAEELRAFPGRQTVVNAIIRRYEAQFKYVRTERNFSIVIAVIDGKTDQWRCGIWGHRRLPRGKLTFHEVDWFMPDGYHVDPKLGNVPCFD